MEEFSKALEDMNRIAKELFVTAETVIEKPTKSFKEISCGVEKQKRKALIYNFEDEIEIIPIFDTHIGLKACNKEQLAETIEYILAAPNRYTILGGDILECATKTSVGMAMYEEEMSPKNQLFYATELFRPLAEAGRILDSLTGNHEMRLANFADMNPMEIMAKFLGIPYSEYQGYILLTIGKQKYKIAHFHGKSGGISPAGVVMSMRKQSGVAEADVYLSGHIHVKAKGTDLRYAIDETTGDIGIKPKKYVVCGSFVDYWGSYAEMQALPPADTGTVKLIFRGDRWAIDVDVPEA